MQMSSVQIRRDSSSAKTKRNIKTWPLKDKGHYHTCWFIFVFYMYIQSLTSQMLLDPCRETASGFSKKGFISSSMPSLMDEIPFCHLPLLYISFNTWDTGTKTYTQRKFFFFIYHMGYVTQSYTTQFGLYGFLLLTQTMFVSVTIMYKKKKKKPPLVFLWVSKRIIES